LLLGGLTPPRQPRQDRLGGLARRPPAPPRRDGQPRVPGGAADPCRRPYPLRRHGRARHPPHRRPPSDVTGSGLHLRRRGRAARRVSVGSVASAGAPPPRPSRAPSATPGPGAIRGAAPEPARRRRPRRRPPRASQPPPPRRGGNPSPLLPRSAKSPSARESPTRTPRSP